MGSMISWVHDGNVALLTDLYELTMAASYRRRGITGPATFDLFVRQLPARRNFLVMCGVEDVLSYLENLRFEDESVGYLRSLELFDEDFLEHLRSFRFSGSVWAFPEGEVAFAGEPLLRVTAPMVEAQLIETFLINCISFQTMIATKAARVAIACGNKQFIDFSPRRDHGVDAALKSARAAFVGGAAATSNVLAGQEYGLPLTGTMAHSYVLAFESEQMAFELFARDFPGPVTLLIDTFDVDEGARRAMAAARATGAVLKGVRIDSGELASLTRSVRRILDDGGFSETKIVLSGDLDEYRIQDLVSAGVPADSFGVGTQLGTSGDEPTLGVVYKLVEDGGGPKMKLSTGKVTYPGRKQVFRSYDEGGLMLRDTIGLEDEKAAGRPLLGHVMEGGERLRGPEPLGKIKHRCSQRIAELPQELRRLERSDRPYDVGLSDGLEALVASVREG